MRKPKSKIVMKSMKTCNICGETVGVYQVIDNAPICYDCVPEQKIHKIPNEKQMLNKILEKDKKLC
jgi:hypothetical protein